MTSRRTLIVTCCLIVTMVVAGCVQSGAIRPGPSTGSWTETEASPWFAYKRSGGFCGPVCYAAVVVFSDGGTLWVTWGPMHDWGTGPGNVTSGHAPTMRADHEPYRDIVGDALRLMKVDPDVRVFDAATRTIPTADHDAIRQRVLRDANTAGEPGGMTAHCEDAGSARVVVYADEYWNVQVTGTGANNGCYRYSTPQPEWSRIDAQGGALWDWTSTPRWTDPAW